MLIKYGELEGLFLLPCAVLVGRFNYRFINLFRDGLIGSFLRYFALRLACSCSYSSIPEYPVWHRRNAHTHTHTHTITHIHAATATHSIRFDSIR